MQDRVYGYSERPPTMNLGKWLAVMLEEVGEAAAAMLMCDSDDDMPAELIREELAQVAAVALCIMTYGLPIENPADGVLAPAAGMIFGDRS